MLSFPPKLQVYLAAGSTDMRKSFDALAAMARRVLAQDPYSGHIFAFCGRRRNLIKILYWDGHGFWIFAKRLASGCFGWPREGEGQSCVRLRAAELAALLGGLDLRGAAWKSWVDRGTKASA